MYKIIIKSSLDIKDGRFALAGEYQGNIPMGGDTLVDNMNNKYIFLSFCFKYPEMILVQPLNPKVNIKEVKELRLAND